MLLPLHNIGSGVVQTMGAGSTRFRVFSKAGTVGLHVWGKGTGDEVGGFSGH